jgi:predicted ester cyclase
MSSQELKDLATRFVEQVINNGDLDRAEEYFTTDYLDHASPPGLPPGTAGLKAFLGMFRAAFPDVHYTLEDAIAEGDKVAQRYTVHATMQGSFLGMPATGKNATWSEIHIARADGSRFVEHWAVIDQLSMLQQLGRAPITG